MSFLYYTASFVCSITATFSQQKYGRSSKTYFDIFLYSLITGIIAMTFFLLSSGFELSFNPRTVMYAAVFAPIVILSYFVILPSFRYMGVAEQTVTVNSLTLLLSGLAGLLIFNERISLLTVLRIVIMLAAVLLLFEPTKNKLSDLKRNISGIGIILCVVTALISTFSTVISKLFATDTGVTDSNSFFFLTNLFTSSVSVLALLILKKQGKFLTELKGITVTQYLMIMLSAVSSNVQSLLGVLILKTGNVLLYVPLTGALGLLASEAVAVIGAKERPKPVPVLLALCSVLLGIFEMI